MSSNINPADGAGNNKFKSADTLSRTMAGRYHAQFPRYKEKTLELLSLVSRGKINGYASIEAKSDEVNSTTGEARNYLRSLTSALNLNIGYDANNVAKIVCDVRSRYGLERFKGNVHKNCIAEIYKVFIIKEMMVAGQDGKNHRVYIPKFALLVD